MVRDLAFEAGVLRGGLLLGLVHEREVPEWAMSVLGVAPAFDARLADVCVSPIELSTMRECLYPLSREADVTRVAAALLTLCGTAPSNAALSVPDRLQQLQLLRHEFRLPDEVRAGIQSLAQRVLAATDGAAHSMPSADELAAWLDTVRQPGYFRIDFTTEEEAAAFVAALSHHADGDRSDRGDSPERAPEGWLHRGSGTELHLLLNEPAWLAASRECGPLPAASRIPVDRPLDSGSPVIARGLQRSFSTGDLPASALPSTSRRS